MAKASEITATHRPTVFRSVRLVQAEAVAGTRSRPVARVIVGATLARTPARCAQRSCVRRLLEILLSLTCPGRDGDWRLARRKSGAPYLDWGDATAPRIHVSLGHSGSWAVAALTTEAGVGADVEVERSGRNTAALSEYMDWSLPAVPGAHFYRRWALWEAYTKCRDGCLLATGGPEFEAICAAAGARGRRQPAVLHGLYLRVADDAHTALVIRLDQPSRVAWRPLPTHHVEPW